MIRERKQQKFFAIAAYKNARQVGYLYWKVQSGSPKTLQVANNASSQVATWSTYQAAEKALNQRLTDKVSSAKDALEHRGYTLEIVEIR